MRIHVCSLALAPALYTRERPSHVVSLLSPEELSLVPDLEASGHAPERHLRIGMHDLRDGLALDGETLPGADHVDEIIAFAGGWNAAAPILVHCWAGVSRSTATAFTIACARNPHADEFTIAEALRAASPTAWPNPLLIAHADAALERDGRMIAAIAAIGMPDHFDASPFDLPADFDTSA